MSEYSLENLLQTSYKTEAEMEAADRAAQLEARKERRAQWWEDTRRDYRRHPEKYWVPAGVVGAIATVALIVSVVSAVTATEEVPGQIVERRWHQESIHQTWALKRVGRWAHQTTESIPRPPVNGRGEAHGMTKVPNSCYQKHYRWRYYDCNPHIVSYTDSEGRPQSRVEYDTCQESIRKRWCDYDTHEWKSVDRNVQNGSSRDENEVAVPPVFDDGFRLGSVDRVMYQAHYYGTFEYQARMGFWNSTLQWKRTELTIAGGESLVRLDAASNAQNQYQAWPALQEVVLTVNSSGNAVSYSVAPQ